MVQSKIDETINYLETNNLDKSDEGESYAYRAKIYNKIVKFVLGNPNFEYINNNIVYFNIYLVEKTKLVSKIGIFEIKNTDYRNFLDLNGNIIIEHLDNPLLFTYAKLYITTKYKFIDDSFVFKDNDDDNDTDDDTDDDTDNNTDDNTDDDTDTDTDHTDDATDDYHIHEKNTDYILKQSNKELVLLKEQTREESLQEISSFIPNESDLWINLFLKSHKYSIIDNEGGGDCFFAVIRDSLNSLNSEKYKNITVKQIRKKLSENLDDNQYNTYMDFYKHYHGGFIKTQQDLKKCKDIHKKCTSIAGGSGNLNQKSEILEKAKINLNNILEYTEQNKEYNTLVNEFKFMKDIKTIDDLRNFMLTPDYWADAWAISTLERLYNIKFIILKEDNFDKNQSDNPFVLQCGETDIKLQQKQIFEPDYYIIVNYVNNVHYKLITYDKNINKSAFKFIELPYKVKEEILNICMVSSNSLFSLIPDFKNFAKTSNVIFKDNINLDSLVEKPKLELFNDDVVIQIYSKSLHKKLGEGSGEIIKKEYKVLPNVIKLFKINDWRKKLDNSWIFNKDNEKLEIKGNLWPSIDHYMYAIRFNNLSDIYNKFTINNDETKTLELAKIFYEKMVKNYKNIISESDYNKIYSEYLTIALTAKFTIQKNESNIYNEEYNNILLLTKDYKINIYKPGKYGGPYEAIELMKIRKLLAK